MHWWSDQLDFIKLVGLEDLLRGCGNRLEGRAGLEGIVRYRHQGGGQDHTSQLRVPYRKNERVKITSKSPQQHSLLPCSYSSFSYTIKLNRRNIWFCTLYRCTWIVSYWLHVIEKRIHTIYLPLYQVRVLTFICSLSDEGDGPERNKSILSYHMRSNDIISKNSHMIIETDHATSYQSTVEQTQRN